MNTALLRKEIAGLRSYLALIAVYLGIELAYVLFSSFPDLQKIETDESSSVMIVAAFLGMLIGANVLASEREYQTQSFLDGLPVGRWAIFWHKTIAAFLVMALLPLLELGLQTFCGWISLTSISPPIPWAFICTILGLGWLIGLCAVSVAMLLSFSRQWFPLLTGLVLLGLIWLRVSAPDWSVWLDSSAVMAVAPSSNGEIPIPWKPLAGHGVVSLLSLLIAGLAFQWRDGGISRWLERVSAWRFSGWLTGIARLAAVGVWIFAISRLASDGEPPADPQPEARAAGAPIAQGNDEATSSGDSAQRTPKPEVIGFGSHKTKHYEVVFRESQRQEVLSFVPLMDATHDEVAAFFQNPPRPSGRIVVDVASTVVRHAAGQTNWTKIRLPLRLDTDVNEFLLILRHETAHVYIEQLSDGRASNYFDALRVFHEGVATAAELSANDGVTDERRRRMERHVALTDSWGRVPLELLCDNTALSKAHDPNLVYALGYVFAESLQAVGGPGLPRRILETLRTSPPPSGVSASELWRHTLQKCQTSFDHVIGVYSEKLDALRAQESEFIAGHPALRGEVSVEEKYVVIRALHDGKKPMDTKVVCVMEVNLGIATIIEPVPQRAEGVFQVARSGQSGNTIRYMLGWSSDAISQPAFGAWAETTSQ